METELWPNFLSMNKKNGAKIIIFNAKLPALSFKRYLKYKNICYSLIFRYIDLIICQQNSEKLRFDKLCNKNIPIYAVGSIKYDLSCNESLYAKSHEMKIKNNLNYVLAALSVHLGEEAYILEIYTNLLKDNAKAKLVFVPRHKEVIDNFIKLLNEQNLTYTIKNQVGFENISFEQNILIANTFGEIEYYLGLCDVIFMGGSFINVGGHNPLEPAYFALPILTGPIYHNFKEQYTLLFDQDGAILCENTKAACYWAKKLLNDPKLALKTGLNALDVQQSGRGSVDKTLKILSTIV